jgi:hypothetical protein
MSPTRSRETRWRDDESSCPGSGSERASRRMRGWRRDAQDRRFAYASWPCGAPAVGRSERSDLGRRRSSAATPIGDDRRDWKVAEGVVRPAGELTIAFVAKRSSCVGASGSPKQSSGGSPSQRRKQSRGQRQPVCIVGKAAGRCGEIAPPSRCWGDPDDADAAVRRADHGAGQRRTPGLRQQAVLGS